MMKAKKVENDKRTGGLMEELSGYSTMLEETSKGSIESARRNDELKTEFRAFYDEYQKEEAAFNSKNEEFVSKIAISETRREEVEAEVVSLTRLQAPLMDKLKSAVAKEETLRAKLKEQAVRFEMFQGLLQDSNNKFSVFKQDMDTNSTTAKNISTENAELRKQISSIVTSIDYIDAENNALQDSLSKVGKQFAQLTLLVEKLKAPALSGGSSSGSGGGDGSASITTEQNM
jgi:chromosome segregation ATPase